MAEYPHQLPIDQGPICNSAAEEVIDLPIGKEFRKIVKCSFCWTMKPHSLKIRSRHVWIVADESMIIAPACKPAGGRFHIGRACLSPSDTWSARPA
jgi:hypothetical protein